MFDIKKTEYLAPSSKHSELYETLYAMQPGECSTIPEEYCPARVLSYAMQGVTRMTGKKFKRRERTIYCVD